MGIWQIIKLAWTYRSQLIWLIQTIESWIQAGIDWAEIQKRLSVFDDAVKKAKATGDTTDLENQFKHPNGV